LDHATYYARLEEGARFLAARTSDDRERLEHLAWANRYYRLRVDAASFPVPVTA
jgi:hypothetical protein